jgi:ESF2/ABP1 family protein
LDNEVFEWFQVGNAGRTSRYVITSIASPLGHPDYGIAYERQAHQSRLRAEIARSKTEQGEYLRNVELARVLDKRKARKVAAGTLDSKAEPTASSSGSVAGKLPEGKKGYKQRTVADGRGKMEGSGMESVLGSVFG